MDLANACGCFDTQATCLYMMACMHWRKICWQQQILQQGFLPQTAPGKGLLLAQTKGNEVL